ncbi:MAG TPA: pitrilysin family protein [Xanthobacteraceae bacterium]|nr:pitrilysin family protein [Xanthobacteraceae bacterium]
MIARISRPHWVASTAGALVLFAAVILTVSAHAATKIERIVSPGGIEAWLVREPSLPLVAIDFSFTGGSSQAPAAKAGLASMVADLLDEGAGDLDSRAFHEKIENYAISLGFSATRDNVTGSLRTLAEHQDIAFDLLKLSLTSPRFDNDDVTRIRNQKMAGLRRAAMSPNELANRRWWETAFPGHPYAAPVTGTLGTLPAITTDDMRDYVKRIFARDNLKIGIVGNVDAAQAGKIVDRIFGSLPAKASLVAVPDARPQLANGRINIEIDVPQSVVMVGGEGIARKDPDFIPAYVLNHILGGGSFSSRLYREVREVRGLAYSVYSTLLPLDRTALFVAGTATRSDRADQSLDVIMQEIKRMAAEGPTAAELADAKSYLKGSFALRFDTSSKIASQLVQMQVDDLGIDYIDKRNGLIEAVTMADVQRAAKRLLEGNMLVAVAGRSQGAAAGGGSGGSAQPAAAPTKRDGG